MEAYKTGDLVLVKLGTLSITGTVVHFNTKTKKYLVRFSAQQQNWYAQEELTPYRSTLAE